MLRRTRALACAAALLLPALSGCANPNINLNPSDPAQRAIAGAGIGAGSGALIGGVIGGWNGAAIGAAAGGVFGAVAGAATTPPPSAYPPQ